MIWTCLGWFGDRLLESSTWNALAWLMLALLVLFPITGGARFGVVTIGCLAAFIAFVMRDKAV